MYGRTLPTFFYITSLNFDRWKWNEMNMNMKISNWITYIPRSTHTYMRDLTCLRKANYLHYTFDLERGREEERKRRIFL